MKPLVLCLLCSVVVIASGTYFCYQAGYNQRRTEEIQNVVNSQVNRAEPNLKHSIELASTSMGYGLSDGVRILVENPPAPETPTCDRYDIPSNGIAPSRECRMKRAQAECKSYGFSEVSEVIISTNENPQFVCK